MWELDGWDGLAANFAHETAGGRDQDPSLAEWWAAAASLRRGGVDRIVVPTPWTRSVERAVRRRRAGRGVRPRAGAGPAGHEPASCSTRCATRACRAVRGARARAGRAPTRSPWRTTPSASCCGPSPTGRRGSPTSRRGRPTARWRPGARRSSASARRGGAQLLVDSPLNPLRTGRQPQASDRRPLDEIVSERRPTDGRHHRRRASTGCGPGSTCPSRWPQPPHHRCHHHRHLPARGRGLRRRQPAVVRPGLRRRHPVGRADRPAAARRAATRSSARTRSPRSPPTTQALMKGDPLRGVHAFYSRQRRGSGGRRCARHAPVARRNALVGVLDKPSEFAERAVHEWSAQVFREADGPAAVGPAPAT